MISLNQWKHQRLHHEFIATECPISKHEVKHGNGGAYYVTETGQTVKLTLIRRIKELLNGEENTEVIEKSILTKMLNFLNVMNHITKRLFQPTITWKSTRLC